MEPVLHRRARRRATRLGIAFLIGALAVAAVPAPAVAKSRGRRYVLPVGKKWAPPHKLDNRHHDYPALDLAIPRWTPIRSVSAGRVRGVTRWGGCGNGVIVKGRDGFEYTYCHGSRVTIRRRARVRPGQRIMLSGSSGHSTGPHLHLQIQGPRGRLLCPQPLLQRWARGIQASPRSSTSRGCAYSPDLAIYRPPPGQRKPPRHRHVHKAEKRRSRKGHKDRKGDGSRGRRRGADKAHARKSGSGTGGKARGVSASRRPGGGRRPSRERSWRKNQRSDRKHHARRDDRGGGKRRGPHQKRGQRNHGRARTRSRAAVRRARARERARDRARERRERIAAETARRRAELALERRVRPLI